ncbi:hypothetical protein BDR05DRAFT_193703 [Suillus weaverae]|nr:hypothetical protein BDR05DRAFT_193703 [Suillus weaverae]
MTKIQCDSTGSHSMIMILASVWMQASNHTQATLSPQSLSAPMPHRRQHAYAESAVSREQYRVYLRNIGRMQVFGLSTGSHFLMVHSRHTIRILCGSLSDSSWPTRLTLPISRHWLTLFSHS